MSTFGHSQGVCVEAVGGAVSEAASSDPSPTPRPVAGACWRDPAPGWAGSGASWRSCGDSECCAEEDTLTGWLETRAIQ